jgi:hypothetical protein
MILLILTNYTFAEAPRHKTRLNEVTDMFDKEVEDKANLEQMIENSKTQAEQGIADKEVIKTLELKENELENKTTKLNSINANSLESEGQREKAKEEHAYYDALEVDYTDPQIINHHKDMDKILSASDRLMGRLIEGLKDLGVDCKTVKGDKEIEPEMYLDIEKEQQRDTVYDQHICEEPRNQYSCSDVVTLKCTNKGSGNFEARTIRFAYNEMPHHWWGGLYGTTPVFGINGRNRGFIDFLGSDTFKHLGSDNVKVEVTEYIKRKTGANDVALPDQRILIRMGLDVLYQLDESGNNGPWEGIMWPPVDTDSTIRFFYRVSQEDKCISWSEEWVETCALK